MIGETISKAARSAKVARALLDGGDFDDAVSRAYYSAFNTARPLVATAVSSSISASAAMFGWSIMRR
jgi:uncharacterized protein (UPF0332 family)